MKLYMYLIRTYRQDISARLGGAFDLFPRNLKQNLETRDVASMPKTDDGGFDPVVSSPAKPLQSDPVLHTCMEGENLQIFMTQITIGAEGKNHIFFDHILSEGTNTIELIILAHYQTW